MKSVRIYTISYYTFRRCCVCGEALVPLDKVVVYDTKTISFARNQMHLNCVSQLQSIAKVEPCRDCNQVIDEYILIPHANSNRLDEVHRSCFLRVLAETTVEPPQATVEVYCSLKRDKNYSMIKQLFKDKEYYKDYHSTQVVARIESASKIHRGRGFCVVDSTLHLPLRTQKLLKAISETSKPEEVIVRSISESLRDRNYHFLDGIERDESMYLMIEDRVRTLCKKVGKLQLLRVITRRLLTEGLFDWDNNVRKNSASLLEKLV